jgi:hypothetical protein
MSAPAALWLICSKTRLFFFPVLEDRLFDISPPHLELVRSAKQKTFLTAFF